MVEIEGERGCVNICVSVCARVYRSLWEMVCVSESVCVCVHISACFGGNVTSIDCN